MLDYLNPSNLLFRNFRKYWSLGSNSSTAPPGNFVATSIRFAMKGYIPLEMGWPREDKCDENRVNLMETATRLETPPPILVQIYGSFGEWLGEPVFAGGISP